MRLDPFEQLVIHRQRAVAGVLQQDIAEALVLVAADEPVVGLAESPAMDEVGTAGPAREGLVVGLDRGGPVPLALEVQGALEDGLGIIREFGRSGRVGLDRCCRGGKDGSRWHGQGGGWDRSDAQCREKPEPSRPARD